LATPDPSKPTTAATNQLSDVRFERQGRIELKAKVTDIRRRSHLDAAW